MQLEINFRLYIINRLLAHKEKQGVGEKKSVMKKTQKVK